MFRGFFDFCPVSSLAEGVEISYSSPVNALSGRGLLPERNQELDVSLRIQLGITAHNFHKLRESMPIRENCLGRPIQGVQKVINFFIHIILSNGNYIE
jgi:hypothetical protein